jgi:hypothetical protein
MRITQSRIRKIIKEELGRALREQFKSKTVKFVDDENRVWNWDKDAQEASCAGMVYNPSTGKNEDSGECLPPRGLDKFSQPDQEKLRNLAENKQAVSLKSSDISRMIYEEVSETQLKLRMLKNIKQVFSSPEDRRVIDRVVSDWEEAQGADAMKRVAYHIINNQEMKNLWPDVLTNLRDFSREGYEDGLAGGLKYNLDLTWTSPNPRGLAQPLRSSETTSAMGKD